MRIVFNDSPHELPAEVSTVDDLITWVQAEVVNQGKVASHISLDGVPFSPTSEELSYLRKESLDRFKQISVMAEDLPAAMEKGLRKIPESLEGLRRLANSIPVEHLRGDHENASEKLLIVIESLTRMLGFLSLCEEHLGDEGGISLRARLVQLCPQIEEAQAQRRWQELSDLLSSSLVELLFGIERWAECLSKRSRYGH